MDKRFKSIERIKKNKTKLKFGLRARVAANIGILIMVDDRTHKKIHPTISIFFFF